MITIYHVSTSRSERIIWLMEELGLDYVLQVFQREANGAAPEALRDIHPLGKAPVIRDGDLVLAESGASSTTSSIATAPTGSPLRLLRRNTRATSIGCISPKAA